MSKYKAELSLAPNSRDYPLRSGAPLRHCRQHCSRRLLLYSHSTERDFCQPITPPPLSAHHKRCADGIATAESASSSRCPTLFHDLKNFTLNHCLLFRIRSLKPVTNAATQRSRQPSTEPNRGRDMCRHRTSHPLLSRHIAHHTSRQAEDTLARPEPMSTGRPLAAACCSRHRAR